MANTVVALKKALNKKMARKFEDGSVVAFTSTALNGYEFYYAAIYIAATDSWYVTGGGNYYVAGQMDSEEFVAFLAKDGISGIAVASDWKAV